MTRGWCQGTYSQREADGTKTYCAVGSIRDTVKKFKNYADIKMPRTCEALEIGIRKTMPGAKMSGQDAFRNCIDWNDRKGRTATQVKRAFRAAIKQVERAKLISNEQRWNNG